MFMTDTPISNKIEIIKRKKLSDERGWFLKTITGKEADLPNYTGEVYVVCGYPEQSRGGHYHIKAKEWFTLISGKATLNLVDINTFEKESIIIDSDDPITIVIPPLIAHSFSSIDKNNFILIAYTDVLYNPDDTINFNL